MAIPFKYNWRSLLVRKVTTLATAAGVALVVVVMILLLSLVTGLKRMLVTTGSLDNFIVLRKGATSEAMSFVPRDAVQALRYLSGIARTPEDDPLVSPELIAQPLLHTKKGGQQEAVVRGVTPLGFLVHRSVHILAGRAPRSALGEAAVGIAASRLYKDASLGDSLQFGQRTWTVIGLFAAGGSAFESEIWVDVDDLLSDTNRNGYSSICLTVAPGADRGELVRRIANDPRISLDAKPEVDYYSEQAESANALYVLTVILAVIMGTGAVFGAMNMMFATVARRTTEIGTLRALGFSRMAVLTSFMSEFLCLAFMGYVIGILVGAGAATLVNLLAHGIALPLPSFSTAVVSFSLSPLILLVVLSLVLVMGILGGFFPAWHAAQLRVTDALRKA